MSTQFRAIGAWYVRPGSSIWVSYGGDPFDQVGIPAGYYYPLGDGSAEDIGKVINDAVFAVAGVNVITLDVDIETGVCGLNNSDVEDMEIAFEDPTGSTLDGNSRPLRDAIFPEYEGQTITIPLPNSTTTTSTRQGAFTLYPKRWFYEDLPTYDARGSQSVSDAGRVTTLNIASLRRHRIEVSMQEAYPRAMVRNEFDAFVDFLLRARSGRPVRIYWDKTITTPYDRDTNPLGYDLWVVEYESTLWEPEPEYNNYYQIFNHELELLKYVAP